jgi:hypothetical protein
MPRASIRATLDVRLRCERFSSLRKQDWIGAPKNTAQTIIAPIRIALTNTVLTNTAPKSTILKSIDRGTWVGETAVLRWREETE